MQHKKKKKNPRKVHSQSQSQKLKENIDISTVLRTVRNLLICQTEVVTNKKWYYFELPVRWPRWYGCTKCWETHTGIVRMLEVTL